MLTWQEHKELVERRVEDPEQADIIVETALLYPEFEFIVDTVDAGAIEKLASVVVETSGYSSVEAFNAGLEQAREEITKVEYQVIGMICKAFPAYKPEDIYEMSFANLMIRFAMAEAVLGLSPDSDGEPMPATPGMESYGGPPDMGVIMEATPNHDRAIRGGAEPPDFTKDNAELSRRG